jgi:hypothetical protein
VSFCSIARNNADKFRYLYMEPMEGMPCNLSSRYMLKRHPCSRLASNCPVRATIIESPHSIFHLSAPTWNESRSYPSIRPSCDIDPYLVYPLCKCHSPGPQTRQSPGQRRLRAEDLRFRSRTGFHARHWRGQSRGRDEID